MESCFILKFIWRNRILGLCMWKPQERKGPDDHGPIPCSAIYVISSLKNLLIFLAIFFTCKKKWLFCYMLKRMPFPNKELSFLNPNQHRHFWQWNNHLNRKTWCIFLFQYALFGESMIYIYIIFFAVSNTGNASVQIWVIW